jgi:hypothetical protein
MTGTLSAISTARRAVPAGIALWRLANRVLGPRWAKVALAAVGVAALVAYSSNGRQRQLSEPASPRDTDDRLDDELSDSFPASDPLTVTRT